MTEDDPRPPALDAVAPSTCASIRAALAKCLDSPPNDGAVELFRRARESARRENVLPEQLVEIIMWTWTEVADATGVPPAERGDRLALILSHAIASVLEGEGPKRS